MKDSSETIRKELEAAAFDRWLDLSPYKIYIDLIAERFRHEDPKLVMEEFWGVVAEADEDGITQKELFRRAFQRFSQEAGNSGGRLGGRF